MLQQLWQRIVRWVDAHERGNLGAANFQRARGWMYRNVPAPLVFVGLHIVVQLLGPDQVQGILETEGIEVGSVSDTREPQNRS
jgi:hypothetical protein